MSNEPENNEPELDLPGDGRSDASTKRAAARAISDYRATRTGSGPVAPQADRA